MTTIKQPSESGLLEDSDDFEPLTREQAQAFREKHPSVSPWVVVLVQACVGLVLAVLGGWWGGSHVAWSVAYGAMTVVFRGTELAGNAGRACAGNEGVLGRHVGGAPASET
jgi:ATP synthase protein I